MISLVSGQALEMSREDGLENLCIRLRKITASPPRQLSRYHPSYNNICRNEMPIDTDDEDPIYFAKEEKDEDENFISHFVFLVIRFH